MSKRKQVTSGVPCREASEKTVGEWEVSQRERGKGLRRFVTSVPEEGQKEIVIEVRDIEIKDREVIEK